MSEMEDPISARMRTYTSAVPRSSHGPADASGAARPLGEKIGEGISKVTGTEKLEGFSLSEFFSEVFSKHGEYDVENFFTVGTPLTTPPVSAVSTAWPKPWLFVRTLLSSVVLYALLRLGYSSFGNANLIPGIMLVGTVAIPCSVLILFVESNVLRNVSLYQVLRVFLFGGVLSLLLTFFVSIGTEKLGIDQKMGALAAGIAEEIAKLAAVVITVRSARFPYRLNALLFGAAVGTGFAVFESLGYALNMSGGTYQGMTEIIFLRGCLAPFGHVIWTAITATALWRVKGRRPFAWSMVFDMRFLRLALASTVMHAIWNSSYQLPMYGKYVLLGVVGWTIVFILMGEGLKEVRTIQRYGTGSR